VDAAILAVAGTSDVWPTIKMRIAIWARNVPRRKEDAGRANRAPTD
jgi:hypothetical protein